MACQDGETCLMRGIALHDVHGCKCEPFQVYHDYLLSKPRQNDSGEALDTMAPVRGSCHGKKITLQPGVGHLRKQKLVLTCHEWNVSEVCSLRSVCLILLSQTQSTGSDERVPTC